MYVDENVGDALEMLLNIFKAQMNLGSSRLELTIKHASGPVSVCVGTIDAVLSSRTIKDIQFQDIVILYHSNFIYDREVIDNVNSINDILKKSKQFTKLCSFSVPAEVNHSVVYFVFKNNPMYRYKLLGNEIMSTGQFVSSGSILNNVAGCYKIDTGNVSYISTLRNEYLRDD